MEEILHAHHVLMETDQSVEMEQPGHPVLMATNQHVPMELNLANLLVRMGTCQLVKMEPDPCALMETCQLVQMEQLQGNLEEDFVKMEPDPCALMETALYVQMERKLPHVQMEHGLPA